MKTTIKDKPKSSATWTVEGRPNDSKDQNRDDSGVFLSCFSNHYSGSWKLTREEIEGLITELTRARAFIITGLTE